MQLGSESNEELNETGALGGVFELIQGFYADCSRIALVSVRRINDENSFGGYRRERT